MELIGSLFLVLALALVVALFLARPFYLRSPVKTSEVRSDEKDREHLRSSLLAERDRILNALQELDFDFAMGKVPDEDYPSQRAALMKAGADVLRRLDEIQPETERSAVGGVRPSEEDRIEAAVSARRADAVSAKGTQSGARTTSAPAAVAGSNGHNEMKKDELEEIIALRKRKRQEKTAGFCPKCGRPVQKSDQFCSRCGTTL